MVGARTAPVSAQRHTAFPSLSAQCHGGLILQGMREPSCKNVEELLLPTRRRTMLIPTQGKRRECSTASLLMLPTGGEVGDADLLSSVGPVGSLLMLPTGGHATEKRRSTMSSMDPVNSACRLAETPGQPKSDEKAVSSCNRVKLCLTATLPRLRANRQTVSSLQCSGRSAGTP